MTCPVLSRCDQSRHSYVKACHDTGLSRRACVTQCGPPGRIVLTGRLWFPMNADHLLLFTHLSSSFIVKTVMF